MMLLLSLLLSISFAQDIVLPKTKECKKVGEFIFSESERAYLAKEGSRLFCAQKINSKSRINSDHFIKESNVLLKSTSAEPLAAEQWYLENKGSLENYVVDNLTTDQIRGKKGEDLNLLPLGSEIPGAPIIVAVLDTGIDWEHPDLKDAVVTKVEECKNLADYQVCLKSRSVKECDLEFMKKDSDGNGYPMDCRGWNLTGKVNPVTKILGDSDVKDQIGHGTHVSGLIAARKNGIGILGVSQNAKILPVKILNSGPGSGIKSESLPLPTENTLPKIKTYGDIFARGLLYAIRSEAKIINMSLGWPYAVESQFLKEMIQLALKKNIILVASAGNDSTNVPLFPCFYTGVVCVGSHNSEGAFARFSNYGANVDLLAPGTKILSTFPLSMRPNEMNEDFGYEYDQGTSMSAPLVSGSIARLLSEGIKQEEIYPRLILGARSTLLSQNPDFNLYDKFSLSGNLSVYQSVKLKPRSLILPKEKGERLISYSPTMMTHKMKLKNFWLKAQKVHLSLTLDKLNQKDIELLTPEFEIEALDSLAEIELELKLKSLHPNAHGEIKLLVRVTEASQQTSFPYSLEMVQPLSKVAQKKVISFSPEIVLNPTDKMRTIEGEENALLYLSTESDGTILKYLTVTDNLLTMQAQTYLKLPLGEMSKIKKIGNQKLILIKELLNNTDIKITKLHYYFFSENFSFLYHYEVESTEAPLSTDNNFLFKNNKYIPAWIAYGKDLNPVQDDPWSTNEDPDQDLFFYSLTERGVEQSRLNKAEDEILLSLIPQTIEDEALGKILVLKAKGEDYQLDYSILELGGEKILEYPLSLSRYQMLGGLIPKLNLENNSFFMANENFLTEVEKTSTGFAAKSNKMKSLNRLSAYQTVYGVFDQGAFLGTSTELVWLNFNTQDLSYTSLKRFSFMPNFLFDKFYTSFLVGDRPVLYLPSGLGVKLTNEILTLNEKNEIIRPAKFRLYDDLGCQELNPYSSKNQLTLRYLCTNSLQKVPVAF